MASPQVHHDRYTVRVSDPTELEGIRFGPDEASKEQIIDVDDTDVEMLSAAARRQQSATEAATTTTTLSTPKRRRRCKREAQLRLSSDSPVLLKALEITRKHSNASLSEKLHLTRNSVTKLALVGALRPNDVLETIYALGTMQEFKCEYASVHDILSKREYYPLNLVFTSPPEPIHHVHVDESPIKKRSQTKSQSTAKRPCLVSLLSSDEEDCGDTDTVEEETKVPEAASICNSLARPDPTPGYQMDEWVLTPFGPGRIESYRVDRFSESLHSLINPLLVYKVSLTSGTLFVSAQHVQPFEGSEFANQVIVSHEKFPLTRGDALRLQPRVYLNDNLVNFFIQRLPKQPRIHVFSSYFYTRIHDLCQGRQDKTTLEFQSTLWQHLRGWIKRVDIWNKDFLLIPIHDKRHWSLLVVCHPGLLLLGENNTKEEEDEAKDCIPCLLHLDSGKRFRLHNYVSICARMRVFLQVCLEKQRDVKRELSKQDLPGGSPPVPAQANETDCGVYMLEWMERFTTTTTTTTTNVMIEGFRVTKEFIQARGNVEPFGKTAFAQSRIDKKRNEYQSLLYTLSTRSEA
jgi:hypothetical protein